MKNTIFGSGYQRVLLFVIIVVGTLVAASLLQVGSMFQSVQRETVETGNNVEVAHSTVSSQDQRGREVAAQEDGERAFPIEILKYPVNFDAIVQMGPSILPALYKILEHEKHRDQWLGATSAIGYLGRHSESAENLKRFLLKEVELPEGIDFTLTDAFPGKISSIHALGLVSGPDDEVYLQEVLSDKSKAELLCLSWNSGIASNEVNFATLSADVRVAACQALVFAQSSSAISHAESTWRSIEVEAFNSGLDKKNEVSLTPTEIHLKYLLVKLQSVKTRSAFIHDNGIEQYLRIRDNTQAYANAILPYIFEERGESLENAHVVVN